MIGALTSIRGRLVLSGAVFILLAVTIALLSARPGLDRFARRSVDGALESQLSVLARAVTPDGAVDPQKAQNVGPFGRRDGGWSWLITGPAGTLRSGDAAARLEPSVARPSPRRVDRPASDRQFAAARPDGRPRDGRRRRSRPGENETFYFRTLVVESDRGPVTLTAGAPRYVRDRLREEALRPLLIGLSSLGAALLVLMLIQLELGLRPLGALSRSLARVRQGQQARITEPQPAELRTVVGELNALLDHNEAALAKARDHVANLAHGLKTPLATLALRLSEPGRDPDGSLSQLLAQIDAAVGHHLGRARAASPGAPGRASIDVGGRLEDLIGALARIYAERNVRTQLEVAPGLRLNCDPQDFDEMAGNLLDNAWKWAAAVVSVRASREGRMAVITIDDDGPGLPEAAAAEALVRGRRLDEQVKGHGFGLSICLELAELHDGSLELARSPLGGLRATLALPAGLSRG